MFPLEITSAAITVQYWTSAVPTGAWITSALFVHSCAEIGSSFAFPQSSSYWLLSSTCSGR